MGCIFLLTSRWPYNLGVYKWGGRGEGGVYGPTKVQLKDNRINCTGAIQIVSFTCTLALGTMSEFSRELNKVLRFLVLSNMEHISLLVVASEPQDCWSAEGNTSLMFEVGFLRIKGTNQGCLQLVSSLQLLIKRIVYKYLIRNIDK